MSAPAYELSIHAAKAAAERELPLEWIERALFSPERTEPDRNDAEVEHRLRRIEEFGGRVLRVVVNFVVVPPRVVTVYFDRTQKRKL